MPLALKGGGPEAAARTEGAAHTWAPCLCSHLPGSRQGGQSAREEDTGQSGWDRRAQGQAMSMPRMSGPLPHTTPLVSTGAGEAAAGGPELGCGSGLLRADVQTLGRHPAGLDRNYKDQNQ